MAQIKKPNTICRNPNCKHGENGGRKMFYACMTCLRSENWKAYCCSAECYEEYTKIILESRSKGANVVMQPERLDMTPSEITEVMETPMQEVAEYTKEVELKDYFEENPGATLSEIVEKVNEDIAHADTENNDLSEYTNNKPFYKKNRRNKSNYSDI